MKVLTIPGSPREYGNTNAVLTWVVVTCAGPAEDNARRLASAVVS